MLVGLALIVNGMFVAKKGDGDIAELNRTDSPSKDLSDPSRISFLEPSKTNALGTDVFSVTDETTQHLEEPIAVKRKS
jgi:hypothetical protein